MLVCLSAPGAAIQVISGLTPARWLHVFGEHRCKRRGHSRSPEELVSAMLHQDALHTHKVMGLQVAFKICDICTDTQQIG